MITFTVPGRPKPKQSFKMGRHGGYTPKGTTDYRDLVRGCIGPIDRVLEGPVSVCIFANFAIPKGTSKANRIAMGGTGYGKRPDCDNIAKSICDAMNGIVYKDDSQITKLLIHKRYVVGDAFCTVTVGEGT